MKTAPAVTTPYRFTLFVVGNEPNSLRAIENLEHISGEYLRNGTCSITIVDILLDYQAALDNNVFVTPVLFVDGPRGRSTIVGNLSDIDRIVLTIGFNK
jgi:circadian clock protein KaiB